MVEKKPPTRLSLILLLIPVVISVPLVLGFLGRFHPAFDAFAHFRAHLAVLMGLFALPLFFTAMKREAVMILLFAAMAFATTQSSSSLKRLAQSGTEATAETGAPTAEYRLLQLNLRFDNSSQADVLRLIGRENADVITLQEVSAEWLPKLKLLESRYPYRLDCAMDQAIGGISILSRRPFPEAGISLCFNGDSFAVASIDLGGQTVHIANIHMQWPWPHDQNEQMGKLISEMVAVPHPLLMAGDFNAVPWSQTIRQLQSFTRTERVSGLGPSWLHRFLPASAARWIGLPLDHVLASEDIIVRGAEMLAPVGSDHLPIRLRFSLKKKPADPEAEQQVQTVGLQ
ncbi:MAG: endonuclease/exonuclease/phosphatase family protein [Phyllobacterium sp.]